MTGPRFFASVVPGIEPVAEEEILERFPDAVFDRASRGLLLFDADAHPDDLLALRCIEDVFATIAVVRPLNADETGARQARSAALRSEQWEEALDFHRMARPTRRRKPTFRVVAQMEGRHAFRRTDLRRAVEEAVVERTRGVWDCVTEGAFTEVWIHADSEIAVIGLRLSDRTLRHRTYRKLEIPGSLKPTVAAAMVRLTKPAAGDVFLDPMCGSGTLLIERALAGRYRLLLGGDIDPNAIDATMMNVGPRYKPIEIRQMDARDLPLETASVDGLATNLPFGRQMGSLATLPGLYEKAFAEFARVVRPEGRAVTLVSKEIDWRAILRKNTAWRLVGQHRIALLGQRPVLLILDRREDE